MTLQASIKSELEPVFETFKTHRHYNCGAFNLPVQTVFTVDVPAGSNSLDSLRHEVVTVLEDLFAGSETIKINAAANRVFLNNLDGRYYYTIYLDVDTDV